MRVCFDFADGRDWAELDLDAVPRVGDEVCWMSSDWEEGEERQMETGYRVEHLEWALSPNGLLPQVLLRMAPA